MSNLDKLTIGEARQLASLFSGALPAQPASGSIQPGARVIVRSRDAGVQYGVLEGYEGSTVHLRDARQMWSWTAAQGGTLIDCARHGVSAGKFSDKADAVTVIGACAIIAVHADAVDSLESRKWK
ncbi:hypothetical protein E5163_14750 [Marinicauda algicola]|uniref:DUF6948 domain-containing protein n=1 Tax=Marinicauda algicola TaxID=2029849 RepID=A0A4S2GWD9_9PROT|nr:hypothetical protein [Marinicauda algicola]TGY87324.1 hypothetical protein E5163_14750 [Marinicauda algicola]